MERVEYVNTNNCSFDDLNNESETFSVVEKHVYFSEILTIQADKSVYIKHFKDRSSPLNILLGDRSTRVSRS